MATAPPPSPDFLGIWNSEAAYLAGEPPAQGFSLVEQGRRIGGIEEASRGYLPTDVLVPDGAYVVLLPGENGPRDGVKYLELHCASVTTPHRLATWHLDATGARPGDILGWDGLRWLAVPPPQPPLLDESRLLPDVYPEDGLVLAAEGGRPVWRPHYPSPEDIYVVTEPTELPPQGFEIVDDGQTPRLRYKSSNGKVYALPMVAE